MNTTRRTFGALLASGFAAAGGCLGFARGNEPLRFEAIGATPSERALQETGYNHQRTETRTVTEDVEVGGITRSVEAVNVIARYDKPIGLGALGRQRGAAFAVYATPQIEVLGRTVNPIADMSHRELARRIQSNFEGIGIDERVGTRRVTVLNTEIDLPKFAGTATFDSVDIPVSVHLGTVRSEHDILVVLGIYPQALADEKASIVTLAESISPNR